MRVGLLTAELSHASGWSHYGLSLALALRRAGADLTVIAARNSPEVDGLPVYRLLPNLGPAEGFSLLRMALAAPRVRSLLSGCDVIHVTAEPYAPIGAWTAGDRPLFITGHGSYVQVDQFRSWPVNQIYRRAFYRSRLVCVSRYTARAAGRALPGVQTVVVNNGVDVERFANLPPPESPKRGPTILTVGGVKARKGTLELVGAVAAVRQHIPDVQCVVIGQDSAEPEYAARVRALIDELGLCGCVHLLGFVSESVMMGWYGAADVFVLPSINAGWKFEGYGLAHLEASAAGLPVIGATDCGAEDAIDDGVTGLLAPQGDMERALPQAILTVLTDPARAAQMGAAGREKARRQTWDHVAAQLLALYQSV